MKKLLQNVLKKWLTTSEDYKDKIHDYFVDKELSNDISDISSISTHKINLSEHIATTLRKEKEIVELYKKHKSKINYDK